MPLVKVNDIQINYKIDDSFHSSPAEETLVLVNGLADDLTTWDLQVHDFVQAGYRVLRFDNRGVGLSSQPAGPYTSEMLASDLHELLLVLEIKKFHLLGISMGGMIAQDYALRFPNGPSATSSMMMLSLSLCCTYAEPTQFCSRMFALWHDMAIKMSIQDVMRDVILWCFTLKYVRERGDELQEVDQAMAEIKMSKESYLAQLNVIQEFDSTSRLLALGKTTLGNVAPGKVLVLAGKEDILIPTRLSKELHDRLYDARWKTVTGGHCCALEYPEEFNETVVNFLRSV